MISIRIMTYNINGCRGNDGVCDPQRISAIIEEAAPDIVALQDVDASADTDQLRILAEKLGMNSYGHSRSGENAFLSYYPLTGIQEFDLGHNGLCQKADLEKDGKKIHIFNVRLTASASRRRQQIRTLLGPELMSSREISCPVLLLGDFADSWLGAGNLTLKFMLQGAKRPAFWGGTYPANFPLFNRDRAYVQGDIRILDSQVIRTSRCRQAAHHLPLILTLQMADTRNYLLSKDRIKAGGRMEIVHS